MRFNAFYWKKPYKKNEKYSSTEITVSFPAFVLNAYAVHYPEKASRMLNR